MRPLAKPLVITAFVLISAGLAARGRSAPPEFPGVDACSRVARGIKCRLGPSTTSHSHQGGPLPSRWSRKRQWSTGVDAALAHGGPHVSPRSYVICLATA